MLVTHSNHCLIEREVVVRFCTVLDLHKVIGKSLQHYVQYAAVIEHLANVHQLIPQMVCLVDDDIRALPF